MAERRDGEPAPATETTIRGADWYQRELAGDQFAKVEFLDTDMSELVTNGAVFADCTFRGVEFSQSSHTNTGFLNCSFVGCGFFGAVFADCKLTGSMFDRCTFSLLQVHGGDWSFVGLPGADLRGTTFTDVRMREADLTGARCHKATIRGADLTGAMLGKVDFTRCDLRGSEFSQLDPFTLELGKAVIDPGQAVVLAMSLGIKVLPP